MWLGLGLARGLALWGSVTLAGRTRGNPGHGSWDTATPRRTAAVGSCLPRPCLTCLTRRLARSVGRVHSGAHILRLVVLLAVAEDGAHLNFLDFAGFLAAVVVVEELSPLTDPENGCDVCFSGDVFFWTRSRTMGCHP